MSKILFSANDPGGAKAIAPVVKALNAQGEQLCGLVSGPAISIFKFRGMKFYFFTHHHI